VGSNVVKLNVEIAYHIFEEIKSACFLSVLRRSKLFFLLQFLFE